MTVLIAAFRLLAAFIVGAVVTAPVARWLARIHEEET